MARYRSSDYDLDGVGRVWTYLYGLDWRLNESVAFRGQFQRAIRAPNIARPVRRPAAELPDADRSLLESQHGEPVRRRCGSCVSRPVCRRLRCSRAGVQPDNIIPSRSGGNPDLQEESSDTRTFGVVLTPDVHLLRWR